MKRWLIGLMMMMMMGLLALAMPMSAALIWAEDLVASQELDPRVAPWAIRLVPDGDTMRVYSGRVCLGRWIPLADGRYAWDADECPGQKRSLVWIESNGSGIRVPPPLSYSKSPRIERSEAE